MRRAWLWSFDEYAGKDYSHRKHWVLARLSQLAGVFAIEVCAYAVMSNHYHLVVRVDQERANAWNDTEVIERWTKLFCRPSLIERYQQGLCDGMEREVALGIIERWRQRLTEVSWYMRCLNEHLARRANQEDECRGRFWEGRFKSQALLDEAGLLTAMAYVDLNPLRAGIADTPEESEFTSVYERIQQLRPTMRDVDAPDTNRRARVPLSAHCGPRGRSMCVGDEACTADGPLLAALRRSQRWRYQSATLHLSLLGHLKSVTKFDPRKRIVLSSLV